jgi:AmpD protein
MSRPTKADAQAWQLAASGWIESLPRIPSPNQDDRPVGSPIRLIVIHYISLPPGQFDGNAITDLFTNQLNPTAHPDFAELAKLRVSAHFLIRRDGSALQFVPCSRRAWHAGVSCWRGIDRCNDFSIGIELEGDDRQDFAIAQYQALRDLLTLLRQHYPIEDIVGHADIAPGRKPDPGPRFDWHRIAPIRPD